LITVTAWSRLPFCGFGILSRINATTFVALALGARMRESTTPTHYLRKPQRRGKA
jgi:hypothetical protein